MGAEQEARDEPLLVGEAWVNAIREAGDIDAALAEVERLSGLAGFNLRRAVAAETKLATIKKMVADA